MIDMLKSAQKSPYVNIYVHNATSLQMARVSLIHEKLD